MGLTSILMKTKSDIFIKNSAFQLVTVNIIFIMLAVVFWSKELSFLKETSKEPASSPRWAHTSVYAVTRKGSLCSREN